MSESILDRAFQLKYIPGSESEVPGEEKLSSLARFDALMRQAEDNRKAREATAKRQQQHLEEQLVARSAFDDDDSSDSDNAQDMDDSDADDNDFAHEAYQGGETPPLISLKAQRALQFISSRPDLKSPTTSPRPSISRNPTSFHANVTPVPTQTPPPMRPHTSNGKARPNVAHRAQSTHIVPSQHGYGFDVARVAEEAKRRPSASAVIPEHYDQTSKRLSFTEFTKRLSSTSSLLLVQTNVSSASSRRSSDLDSAVTPGASVPRASLRPPTQNNNNSNNNTGDPNLGVVGRDWDEHEQNKRCSWRGNVGVVGTEGGFF